MDARWPRNQPHRLRAAPCAWPQRQSLGPAARWFATATVDALQRSQSHRPVRLVTGWTTGDFALDSEQRHRVVQGIEGRQVRDALKGVPYCLTTASDGLS